ncbi:MAG: hypothetical protein P3W93_008970 [Thermus sp.]|nr:hypothetical protein [Thermus sp.]
MGWIGAILLLSLSLGAMGEEAPKALSPGPRVEVLRRCAEVVRALEVQALYKEGGTLVLVLGQGMTGNPLLLLALEKGKPLPHAGPIRGRPLRKRLFPFVRELSLARQVLVFPKEYRCFVLHRGRVVGVLRLGLDLVPLPIPLLQDEAP